MISDEQNSDAPPAALRRLEDQARRDLGIVAYPNIDWVRPVQGPTSSKALDCLIVGGGQFGIAVALALRRECVTNIVVLDEAEAGYEGPWANFARMQTLRTPKTLTGPDLGIPSLTFRAWCDARHGAGTWDRLDRIPRLWWMDYLAWYRRTLDLPVRNRVQVSAVVPVSDRLFRVEAKTASDVETLFARTVVFANGAVGSGALLHASIITDAVPRDRYAHTNEPIDFASLRGKRIGILGVGASAFDNAATALENGASEAHVFCRRPALPRDNPRRWMEFSGFLAHYPELPDARRWAYMQRLLEIGQPPPTNTYARATALPGFRLHTAAPWLSVICAGPDASIEVTTPAGRYAFDFVIGATGIEVDMTLRPELAAIAPHVATWADRYDPPEWAVNARLSRFPYLDRFGAFTERETGRAPWAGRAFAIFRGATLSLGPSAASNSNMKYTVPRLVSGITRQLFLDAADCYFDAFVSGDHLELRQTG
jgi:cation diffusion facilitator CzcD-associated flavoprotein CzcO